MFSMIRCVNFNKGRILSICNNYGKKNIRSVSTSNEDTIQKSVFISQSTDIFTNLALEDWFYRNYNFTNHHILLLWRNNPCVVIGRHQNPWLEANCQALEESGITLARRNSGGGTVFHDSGNLNMSFFTPKTRYNRRYNLEIITKALYREWGLKTDINKRDDIIVNENLKVSGTAAKLGRVNAYHHCTLLVNVNKANLSVALERKETGISTNATESLKSPIKNLHDLNNSITVSGLMDAIGWEYLRTKAITLEDGGTNLVQKQKGFQMIRPSEDWFPGLDELRKEFESWYWNYGKSPKFTVTRQLKLPAESTDPKSSNQFHLLNLILEVKEGIVEDIKLSLPPNFIHSDSNQDASVITNLRGSKYSYEFVDTIIAALGCTAVPSDAVQSAHKSNVAATQ